MPVHIARQGGNWRVVEHDGSVAKTPEGHARDGGGHGVDREKALAQMRAINMHLKEEGKIK